MTPGNFPFHCRKEVSTDPTALRNNEVDPGRIEKKNEIGCWKQKSRAIKVEEKMR